MLVQQMFRHKLITIIILALIVAGGYFGYQRLTKSADTVRYVTAAVEKGTLIVSVSGTGQVLVSNQADIKSKVSGDAVYVGVKNGQEVKAGALLVQIDSREAQKTVRNAETALETAKLDLEELLKPADELTLLQAENSLIQLKESKRKSEDSLAKTFEDGFNAVVSAFFDLPTVVTEAKDVLYGYTINKAQENISAYADLVRAHEETKVTRYKNSAASSYTLARSAYDENFQNYKAASRYSDNQTVEALVNETYEAAKKIAIALKDADNLISFVEDTLIQWGMNAPAIISTHRNTIKTDTGKVNSIISNLLSIKTTFKTNREAILSAERSIAEKELSLAKLKAGADELDVRAKKIAIQQKEDALVSARQTLADHYIRAPFSGIVAKINAKKGEAVGASVATLITKQKIAEISLNEVDVAKVKNEQKATLTFDAIPDFTATGKVTEVDTVGTASQGVVTYTVKIAFDTQDERIKPAMSVSAAIITEVKPDVLLISNSAIKQEGERSYVEAPDEADASIAANNPNGAVFQHPLRRQSVETGLFNDEFTEIVSGLKQGDFIVSRIIQPTSLQTPTQQGSGSFRIPGLQGGGFR